MTDHPDNIRSGKLHIIFHPTKMQRGIAFFISVIAGIFYVPLEWIDSFLERFEK